MFLKDHLLWIKWYLRNIHCFRLHDMHVNDIRYLREKRLLFDSFQMWTSDKTTFFVMSITFTLIWIVTAIDYWFITTHLVNYVLFHWPHFCFVKKHKTSGLIQMLFNNRPDDLNETSVLKLYVYNSLLFLQRMESSIFQK